MKANRRKGENEDLSKTYETYDKLTTEKIDFSKVKVEPLFEDMVDFDTFSNLILEVVKLRTAKKFQVKKLLKFTLDDGSEKKSYFIWY